ncbi:MAG: galactokinase [Thermodesulfobacteriota bacterium]
MPDHLREILAVAPVEASAPCRIDMGGTLDISTFYYPLRHLHPCTFNMALDMRTRVRLLTHDPGRIKVSSAGFESAEFALDEAPFEHPLGLIFAIAAYFRADGVHIEIASESPVRSSLGGSSVAAVALVGAFSAVFDRIGLYRGLYRREIAILAHALEESVAGTPCGLQDQLAAAYGGVNAWHWFGRVKEGVFEKASVMKRGGYPDLERRLLLAHCGRPHHSHDTNGRWIREFVQGRHRNRWAEIIQTTRRFIDALSHADYRAAADAMNRETAIRRQMTPEVLDETGNALAEAAEAADCGFRFAGAGGGGCVWALGPPDRIDSLRDVWEKTLANWEAARLLDVRIDPDGLKLPVL